jgi:hypothetical protein
VVVEICSEYDGKNTDAAIYPCASQAEADEMAEAINDYNQGVVLHFGGYPDGAWVLDLTDPNSFEDTQERKAELDEWERDE